VALRTYERERGISDVERKAKDEKLSFAATLLCRASGLFEHVSTTVLSDAEQTPGYTGRSRPPELSKEVASALSKCAFRSPYLAVLVRGSFIIPSLPWTDSPLPRRNPLRSAN
jgi:hypothetical protein